MPTEKDLRADIHRQKLSVSKIARKYSVCYTTAKRWLIKFNLLKAKYLCSSCKETRVACFTKGRYTECKVCRSKRQIDLRFRYKRAAVDYLGGKCSLCGYDSCLAALDFHHRDPAVKDPNWRKMAARCVNSKVKAELDKCVLLCRNCHAELHYPDNNRIKV